MTEPLKLEAADKDAQRHREVRAYAQGRRLCLPRFPCGTLEAISDAFLASFATRLDRGVAATNAAWAMSSYCCRFSEWRDRNLTNINAVDMIHLLGAINEETLVTTSQAMVRMRRYEQRMRATARKLYCGECAFGEFEVSCSAGSQSLQYIRKLLNWRASSPLVTCQRCHADMARFHARLPRHDA